MRRDKIARIVILILNVAVLSVYCMWIGFLYILGEFFYEPPPPRTHQEFKTNYTEEEHIERISNITEKFIEKDWSRYNRATVVDYDIEIMYSFYDNDPEYFILTYYLEKPWLSRDYMFDCFDSMDLTESFYYCHAYGAIVDDEYKLFFPESWVYCDSIYPRFFMGRNVFETMGYGDCKKYYGNNCFGIENENGEIVLIRDDVICSYDEIEPGIYFAKSSPIAPEFNYLYHLYNEEEPICDKCYKQRVLTLEEQKDLMGWGMEDRKFGDYIYTNKVYVRSH